MLHKLTIAIDVYFDMFISTHILSQFSSSLKNWHMQTNKQTKGGRKVSTTLLLMAVLAIGLMAIQQGSFVSNLRGKREQHRQAISISGASKQSFAAALQTALDIIKNKHGDPARDKSAGSAICSVLSSVVSDASTDAGGGGSDGGNDNELSIAAKRWTSYVADVLAASKHPDDPKYSHMEWTKSLLVELSPSAMARALVSQPPPKAVARVLQIVRNRLYDADKYPPLRVAVLGGGETEGQGCDIASVPLPEGSIMANPTYCSWPYRFEQLVNNLAGGMKLVEVTNLAEDGTDTAFMTPLLRNWIYPQSLLPHGPDIIINAYTSKDYSSYGAVSVKDTEKDEMEAFIDGVEGSNPCGDPPLIVHLDDSADGTAAAVGTDRVLSLQYSTPMAKVIKTDKATKTVPSHLPFGMAGHLALSWMLTFALGDMALHHCSSEQAKAQLAPAIMESKCKDSDSPDASSRCTFAFFAGPMGTVTRPNQIQQYVAPYVVENTGWQATTDMSTGFSRKSGLVAMQPGAKLVFQFQDVAKEIRYINLMTLRSSADEWKDGKAKFALLVNNKKGGSKDWLETSFEIEGGHALPTHITYHFGFDLKDNTAKVGSDVIFRIESVGATSFKILGIMLCS